MTDYTNTYGGAAKDAGDDIILASDLDTEFDNIVTAVASKANTAKVEATGDTSAGDNAAMGYTSTEGLILTGQGSSNDITLKNDADTTVMSVATGTTTATFAGKMIAGGDTAAGDQAAIGYTATEGLILTGQGSTNDVTIKNDADGDVISIPTGTTITELEGGLVLNERADHEATPGAAKAEIWLDDATTQKLMFTDDAGTDLAVVAVPAAVTNHTRAGNTQIWTGAADWGSSLDLVASLTESTWESVGPTGSGADNVWTPMDVLPSNATILIASLRIRAEKSSTGRCDASVYWTYGDDGSPALGTGEAHRNYFSKSTVDSSESYDQGSAQILIPLGPTNQDFQLYWGSNGDNDAIYMDYVGFMTD